MFLLVKKDLNILLDTNMLKKWTFWYISPKNECVYRKDFDETDYVCFLIKDDELLEKSNEIWEKVSNAIKKEFDSNPVYNKKSWRTKTKSYNGKINTYFQNNKIPKEDSWFICLSVIWIDSIFRAGKNCYPQVLLEECKYVMKAKKIHNYINDDVEISSDSDEKKFWLWRKFWWRNSGKKFQKNSDEEDYSEEDSSE